MIEEVTAYRKHRSPRSCQLDISPIPSRVSALDSRSRMAAPVLISPSRRRTGKIASLYGLTCSSSGYGGPYGFVGNEMTPKKVIVSIHS